ANNNDGTVSVINGATCNARVTSGCAHPAPAVTTGAGPTFTAVDSAVHTMFAMNQNDNTLSALDTRTCRGGVTSGGATHALHQQAAPSHGRRYRAFPNSSALIRRLSSLYLVSNGGGDILSVLNPSRCDAIRTAGCRREAPSVPDGEFL